MNWLRWYEYVINWCTPALFDAIFGSDVATPDYSQAINAAKFTPYSVSTGFGTSNFNTDNKTAGYTLDPKLAQFRDMFYGGAQGMAPTQAQTDYANNVSNYGMNLFGKAANLDTNQLAQNYYNQQQSLMQPGRAQESSQLADTLFKTGRTGVGVGMTNNAGQTGYINPEQFSLLSARAGADAQLGMQSTDKARQQQIDDIKQALATYGMGQQFKTDPYTAINQILGYGTGVESLGFKPLAMGADIGNSASQAGANQAKLYAGQEDARVAAENTPSLFDNLLSGLGQAGLSYATGGMSALGSQAGSAGGWMSNLFGSTPTPGTSNVSPGIRF